MPEQVHPGHSSASPPALRRRELRSAYYAQYLAALKRGGEVSLPGRYVQASGQRRETHVCGMAMRQHLRDVTPRSGQHQLRGEDLVLPDHVMPLYRDNWLTPHEPVKGIDEHAVEQVHELTEPLNRFYAAGDMTHVRIVGLGYDDSPASQAMRKFFAEGNRWTLDHIAKRYWPKCSRCEKEESG